MKKLLNAKGFTLLEMTIVVSIIGVLMLVAMPNYRGVAEMAQKRSCDLNQRMIAAQADNYYIDRHISLPEDDVNTSENEPLEELVNENYLKELPQCPSGGSYSVSATEDPVAVYCTTHP
jgi:general secretion pathway protein G